MVLLVSAAKQLVRVMESEEQRSTRVNNMVNELLRFAHETYGDDSTDADIVTTFVCALCTLTQICNSQGESPQFSPESLKSAIDHFYKTNPNVLEQVEH